MRSRTRRLKELGVGLLLILAGGGMLALVPSMLNSRALMVCWETGWYLGTDSKATMTFRLVDCDTVPPSERKPNSMGVAWGIIGVFVMFIGFLVVADALGMFKKRNRRKRQEEYRMEYSQLIG